MNAIFKLILNAIVLFFLTIISFESFATTYYMCNSAATCNAASSGWATGNNSNACTTKGAPCLTLQGAFGKMLSGDTLIITQVRCGLN